MAEESHLVAYDGIAVKVRFQSPEVSGRYRSTFHAFTTIVREERFRGLYKGIASPMVRVISLIAMLPG